MLVKNNSKYIQLVIDWHEASVLISLSSININSICKSLNYFVQAVLYTNPLVEMGIITIKNGKLQSICEATEYPVYTIQSLKNPPALHETSTYLSQENLTIYDVLNLLNSRFETSISFGQHGTLLFFTNSSSPIHENINLAIERAKRNRISVSFGNMYEDSSAYRNISDQTCGEYMVLYTENQLFEFLNNFQHKLKKTVTTHISFLMILNSSKYRNQPLIQIWELLQKSNFVVCPNLSLSRRNFSVLNLPNCYKYEILRLNKFSALNFVTFQTFENIPSADVENEYIKCYLCCVKLNCDTQKDLKSCTICSQYYCAECVYLIRIYLKLCPSCTI